MSQVVPESDLPGNEVPTSDLPGAEDLSKYQGHPISTFAANAVNALTFGLPEYLNKKFTPETYAEGQKYQEANPLAANLGTATGTAAGYAIPGAYGAVKGAQLGGRAAQSLMSRVAPNLPANVSELGKLYGRAQGAVAGGTMGAQAGVAAPGVIQGNPGEAVAGAEMVNQMANQIPMVSHLSGLTGHIVPAVAGGAASMVAQERQRQLNIQKNRAILAQPPTANNFIERMKAMSELYGGIGQ